MIIEAILKINPDAKVFVHDTGDINTSSIEWLDGTTPISVSDIQAKITELPTDEELKQNQETKKASGKQKLKDLGLDDDEIQALIGV